jgi:hypothetical protein
VTLSIPGSRLQSDACSKKTFVHIFACPPPPTSPLHYPGQVYCSWSHITEQVQGRLCLPLFCRDDGTAETPGPRAVNEPIPGAWLTTKMEVKELAVVELQLLSPGNLPVQLNAQVRLELSSPPCCSVPCLLDASTWR